MWLTVLANDASTSWNSMPDVGSYSRTASCSRCFDLVCDNGNRRCVPQLAQGRPNQSPNARRTGSVTEFFKIGVSPHTWHLVSSKYGIMCSVVQYIVSVMMVCLIVTHNVIRIYHKTCCRQLSYSEPPCTCGFDIREKKPDEVCGFLAYFCAVLRFSDPPYAPAPSIMYTDEMFRFLLISLAMLVLYGSMYETQGCWYTALVGNICFLLIPSCWISGVSFVCSYN